MSSHPPHNGALESNGWLRPAPLFALAAIAIGVSGALGWILDIDALKRIHPSLVSMKFNTAACLVMSGIAAILLSKRPVPLAARAVSSVLATMIAAVGAMTLAEHIFGWNAGIDQVFFQETAAEAGRSFPGRMGVAATLNFSMIGLSLLLIDRKWLGRYWTDVLAFATLTVTMLVFLYYFYGIDPSGPNAMYTTIALHTVVAFVFLCVSILSLRPERGFIAYLLSPSAGSVMARRMVPAALFFPIILGWLRTLARNHDLVDPGFGTAAFVVLIILASLWGIFSTAVKLNRAESARTGAAANLEMTARNLAVSEKNLSETNERLRFLVELNSATQRLVDPDEIMSVTARMLGTHLGVDRCAYAEVENESVFVITGDYLRGVPSIVGRWPVAAFGSECTRQMKADEAYVVENVDADPRIGPAELPAYRATTIVAVICVPLHKAGRFSAAMAVHQTRPRKWTPGEIELVQYVVARCWESIERARVLRSLRESEQRLRFMAEAMPQKIFTAMPGGGVDYLNRQWFEFIGRPFEELKDWQWTRYVHPDDVDENMRRWKRSIETGEEFQIEHRFRRSDGVYRWHLTRAHAMRDAKGEIILWIGSNTDIDDQKKAQQNLEEAAGQLSRSNRELEQFAYVASHDLQEPLRKIITYSERLAAESSGLGGQGKDYFERMRAAGLRMKSVIEDLLQFSKISVQAPFDDCDLSELVSDVVSDLEVMISESNASIELEPLPRARCSRSQMRHLFQNLITNAIKFSKKNEPPKIRISGRALPGGEIQLRVSDNGIGFDQKYAETIFKPFQRLHDRKSYEGTGIGLAIVQKIAHNHKGRVTAQSRPGEGSTFTIELHSPVNAGMN